MNQPMRLLSTFALLLLAACDQGHDNATVSVEADQENAPNIAFRLTKSEHVMVVAHRGCWRGSSENSLESVQRCIDAGVEMVELDVRRTKDGVLVLLHDDTLDRTTSGSGALADKTYDEIAELLLRTEAGGSGSELTENKIPKFSEVLALADGGLLINVDAKDEVFADASAMVQEHGIAEQVLFKIGGSVSDIQEKSESIDPECHFMPILVQSDQSLSERILELASTRKVAYEIVFDELPYLLEGIDSMRGDGMRVWANTMLPRYSAGLDDAMALEHPDAVWGRLVESGVNMIQTDQPLELQAYLGTRLAAKR